MTCETLTNLHTHKGLRTWMVRRRQLNFDRAEEKGGSNQNRNWLIMCSARLLQAQCFIYLAYSDQLSRILANTHCLFHLNRELTIDSVAGYICWFCHWKLHSNDDNKQINNFKGYGSLKIVLNTLQCSFWLKKIFIEGSTRSDNVKCPNLYALCRYGKKKKSSTTTWSLPLFVRKYQEKLKKVSKSSQEGSVEREKQNAPRPL